MTATMLATLVEEGSITWETTILDVFPEWQNLIHEDYHSVTVHDLVTHRSGMPRDARDWEMHEDEPIIERRKLIILDNLGSRSQVAPNNYHYSNLGYVVAGSMAERITGKSWEMLMEERLFQPLNMTTAGFGHPGTQGRIDQPWGHVKSGRNWNAVQTDNPDVMGPSGQVHSSFEDWAKFIALQFSDEDTAILKRSSLDFWSSQLEIMLQVG